MMNNPKSRKWNIVVQELKNEVLVYDLIINKAYCLNQTSALVWNLCDGNTSVSEITQKLNGKIKQPVTDDFVWLALSDLKKENLLDDGQETINKFDELSRREVIRKVGLASMIALPVITSLVAPTVATAQSSLAAPGIVLTGTYPAPNSGAGVCLRDATATRCQSGRAQGTCVCPVTGGPCNYNITCL